MNVTGHTEDLDFTKLVNAKVVRRRVLAAGADLIGSINTLTATNAKGC